MPELTQATVSYTAAVLCNMGSKTYENFRPEIGMSRTFDVSDLTAAKAKKFLAEQMQEIKVEVDALIEAEYKENSIYAAED